MARIAKIISGGQTGADRGGLDAAIEAGIRHGGNCPKDRRSEDGSIPGRYELREGRTRGYLERTEQNIVDAHGTIVFTIGRPTGGSRHTITLAGKWARPCIHIDLAAVDDQAAAGVICGWLSGGGLQLPGKPPPPPNPVINIAGSRESNAAGIGERVKRILLRVLDESHYPVGSE